MALSLLDPTFAQLFGNDFFPNWPQDEGGRSDRSLRPIPIDLLETPKEFIVKADIPGVKKDQIKVTVDEDVLTISVEPSVKQEQGQQQEQEGQQAQQAQQAQQTQQGEQKQGEQKQGEKKEGEQQQGGQDDIVVHRKERVQRFARRRIRMPISADLKNIRAMYQDGVLELHIPKDEDRVKKHVIPVS